MSRGLCGACGEWFDDVTPCKCGEYWQRVRIDPKTRALSVAPVVTATIQLADDSRKIECPFCGKSWIGFKYNAVDPRNGISERAILDIVQAMAEESLSPDNFEGLMRALEALKTTRNVDADSVDPRKHPMFTVSCPNCDYEYMDPFEDGSFECPECELYLPPKKDPRKAMLDEIRTRIYQEFDSCEHRFVHQVFESIFDEMEAKL